MTRMVFESTVTDSFLEKLTVRYSQREDFDYLIEHPIDYKHLKSHSERIVQFHRLVLLMNIDGEITDVEIIKLHNFGLRMGLNHESINKVLYLMESFPNKIVPPDVLIDIFKVQYN